MLKLKFFKNSNGVAVGDLYLDEQRLIATTHPATIVAVAYLLDISDLMVVTEKGAVLGSLANDIAGEASGSLALAVVKMRLEMNPENYQFTELATTPSEDSFLRAIDVFSYENWDYPGEKAQEHLDTARYLLPAEYVVKRFAPIPRKS